MQGAEVVTVDEFKWLGSDIQSKGLCTREVWKTVQAGWSRWRRVSGVICEWF